jgi:hypothetical protein
MTALQIQKVISRLDASRQSVTRSCTVFLRDVGYGLLEVSHNTLALVGLVLVAVLLFIAGQRELRHVPKAPWKLWPT